MERVERVYERFPDLVVSTDFLGREESGEWIKIDSI